MKIRDEGVTASQAAWGTLKNFLSFKGALEGKFGESMSSRKLARHWNMTGSRCATTTSRNIPVLKLQNWQKLQQNKNSGTTKPNGIEKSREKKVEERSFKDERMHQSLEHRCHRSRAVCWLASFSTGRTDLSCRWSATWSARPAPSRSAERTWPWRPSSGSCPACGEEASASTNFPSLLSLTSTSLRASFHFPFLLVRLMTREASSLARATDTSAGWGLPASNLQ